MLTSGPLRRDVLDSLFVWSHASFASGVSTSLACRRQIRVLFRLPPQVDGPQSHAPFSARTEIMEFGDVLIDVDSFERLLYPYFASGTYDLLRSRRVVATPQRCSG